MTTDTLTKYNSFSNLVAGLGTQAAKSSHSAFSRSTHADEKLIELYEGNWLAKKAVNCQVDDIVYGGRVADDITLPDAQYNVSSVIRSALIYYYVVGGSVIYFDTGVDNKGAARPWSKREKLKRLVAIPKSELHSIGEVIKTPTSAHFGLPEFIQLNNTGTEDKIHISRVYLLPESQPFRGEGDSFWRASVLASAYDLVVEAGVSVQLIEDLLWEKKTDTYKVTNLMDLCATDEGSAQLLKRFALAAQLKSIYNANVLDGTEDFISTELNLSGIDTNVMLLLTLVAGAFDVPVTRLLGVSPSGLNATGESDLQNYYQGIEAKKQSWLTPFYTRFDEMVGVKATWHFETSRTLSDVQLADIDAKQISTAAQARDLVPDAAILRFIESTTRLKLTPEERVDALIGFDVADTGLSLGA